MDLFIRAAQLKDAKPVHFILSEMGYADLMDEAFIKTWEEYLIFSGCGVLVAEYDGMVVGFLSYSNRPILSATGNLLKVDELGVLAKARGQGIGTKLLNEIKKIGREKKSKCLMLSTNRERESYKRDFYIKQGFVEKNSAWLKFEL